MKMKNRLEERFESPKEKSDKVINEILSQLKNLSTTLTALSAKVDAPKNLFSTQDARIFSGKFNPLLLTAGSSNTGKAARSEPALKSVKFEPPMVEQLSLSSQAASISSSGSPNFYPSLRSKIKAPPAMYSSQESVAEISNINLQEDNHGNINQYRAHKKPRTHTTDQEKK
ncbi:hypothetical protein EPUL_002720 [Erysiphe pulchra]|uniref:Uncharacterized protein n=1 Tax=Erysiphe pulchra TaxID=225359 RepID=A0A2S4PNR1_9PEZI|nr:hypothetical protein EPUL_002720 [Erysiphe pulchra]